jgi:hypothetical protein
MGVCLHHTARVPCVFVWRAYSEQQKYTHGVSMVICRIGALKFVSPGPVYPKLNFLNIVDGIIFNTHWWYFFSKIILWNFQPIFDGTFGTLCRLSVAKCTLWVWMLSKEQILQMYGIWLEYPMCLYEEPSLSSKKLFIGYKKAVGKMKKRIN